MDPENRQQTNTPSMTSGPEGIFRPSYSPQAPTASSAPQPLSQPAPVGPNDDFFVPSDNKKKKFLIIGGVILVILIVLIIVGVLASPGKKKNNQNNTDQNTNQSTGIIKEPQAIDVENANNSIGSDITGLNDSQDFPETNLNDKNLGL